MKKTGRREWERKKERRKPITSAKKENDKFNVNADKKKKQSVANYTHMTKKKCDQAINIANNVQTIFDCSHY